MPKPSDRLLKLAEKEGSHVVIPGQEKWCWCKPKLESGQWFHNEATSRIPIAAAIQNPTSIQDAQKIIGQRLRDARELRGWSRRDLAAVTGITELELSHYETGRRLPSFSFRYGPNLAYLGEALDLDLSALILEGIVWGKKKRREKK